MTANSGYGRNAYQAVQNYRSVLQRTISCVTSSVILSGSAQGYRPGSKHRLVLGPEEAVKLPGVGVSLAVQVFARVAEHEGQQGPWRADTVGYYYALLDGEEKEIIAYHWHPEGRSPITFPHLHLGAGAMIGREEFQKAHVPTGPVELEDVLLMAIREFGARPQRSDWADILTPR